MKPLTSFFSLNTKLSTGAVSKIWRTSLLFMLLCCLSVSGFATAWSTNTPGVVTNLANWTNGSTSPTSFTTPGDTWTITQRMTLTSGTWTLGASASLADTVTFSTGGSLTVSGSTATTVTIYGNLVMNGGMDTLTGAGSNHTLNVYGNCNLISGGFVKGGAGCNFTFNLYGNYAMGGGVVSTAGSASGIFTLNINGDCGITAGAISAMGSSASVFLSDNGNFSMTGGTTASSGAGTIMIITAKGNCGFSGPAAMTNTGAGCTSTVHLALPSGSGTMLIHNTSTATWSGTNVYVDTACTAQLDANFSTALGATIGFTNFGFTVNGTLICPAADTVTGNRFFTVNGVATLVVAHGNGINGAVITTGTTTFNAGANYTFNGAVPQFTGTYLPASLLAPSVLTINNSSGVTLSQATATTGTLAFTSGILHTAALTMSTPGTAASVTGAGATNYVQGTLIKTITGLASVNYEVGDLDYAPMALTLASAGSAGSIGLMATHGLHPSVATSGLSTANMANHYWTITNSGAAGPATVIPKATYNFSDILGGTNVAFLTQEYTGSAWLSAALITANTITPYTSAPTGGIPLASLAGDYIFGNIACGTLPISGPSTVCVGATVSLSDATSGGTWSSSTTTVATVSSSGVVTGVSTGTTTISYTQAGCTATQVITVIAAPSAGVITGINEACIGMTSTLSDTVSGGTWSSSSAGVATVAASGVVTGTATGSATISYTVSNACGSSSATVNFTVGTTVTVGAIAGTDSVCPGHTTTLSDATGGGTWTSLTTTIATVSSSGVVTGVAPGYDTISYTVTTACGSATAKQRIKVRTAASCAAGVENTTQAITGTELTVFPNPNTGMFTINLLSDIDEPVKIVVTNMVGEKVKEIMSATNQKNEVQLNTTPGIYLIYVSGDHTRSVAKVVIE